MLNEEVATTRAPFPAPSAAEEGEEGEEEEELKPRARCAWASSCKAATLVNNCKNENKKKTREENV